MEKDLALGSSSGLHGATIRASQLTNGSRHAGVWLPRKQSLCGKVSQCKSWPVSRTTGNQAARHRHGLVRADMTASATTTTAPLLLETPSGQFLAELLLSHPHLVPAAAEQQLEALAEARIEANSGERSSSATNEAVLYKRIAELRAQERCKSLEDIMYALISQKFFESGISFVPQIPSGSRKQRVDTWPSQDKELESIHSEAALELIHEHLDLVLGGRGTRDSDEENATAQISKLRMGRVYAASAVYGYFISRMDKRFQMERIVLNMSVPQDEMGLIRRGDRETECEVMEMISEAESATAGLFIKHQSNKRIDGCSRVRGRQSSSGRLRAYIMAFDPKVLQRYATVRSKESVSIIERHTEALFGKPQVKITPQGTVAIAKDEVMTLSFLGLRRLVLEAVAFGNLLWDVETFVDTYYQFL